MTWYQGCSVFAVTFQTNTRLSIPPEAICAPSGDQATALVIPVWPWNVRICLLCSTSTICTDPSAHPAAASDHRVTRKPHGRQQTLRTGTMGSAWNVGPGERHTDAAPDFLCHRAAGTSHRVTRPALAARPGWSLRCR